MPPAWDHVRWLEHDPHAGGMVLFDEFQQTLVHRLCVPGHRSDIRYIGLALEQHALDAHQITGQEHDDELAAAILDLARARDPAGSSMYIIRLSSPVLTSRGPGGIG